MNRLRNVIRARLQRLAGNVRLHQLAGRLLRRREFRGDGSIRNAQRILILKVDEIGDVVLATGFFRSIRRQCPQARITVMLRERCAEMIRVTGLADEILILPDDWRGIPPSPRILLKIARQALKQWGTKPPDWVLIPRSPVDFANVSYYANWTRGRNICAHSSFCSDSQPDRSPLCTLIVAGNEPVHELDMHRRMLGFLGLENGDCAPEILVPKHEQDMVDNLLALRGAGSCLVAFGVGASDDGRRWPAEKFAGLASALAAARPGLTAVIVGGAEDAAIGQTVFNASPNSVINFAGQLSLLQTAALLRRCLVYAGNDTGPMHMAAALGAVVVEISQHPKDGDRTSYNSPARFGPVASWSRILQPEPLEPGCATGCKKSYAHCITNINVEDVTKAVCMALERKSVEVGAQGFPVQRPA